MLVGALALGALARRAAASWREPARPLLCGSVVGRVEQEGEWLTCADDRGLGRCGPLQGGHLYRQCTDLGMLRGALLRLCEQPVDVSFATADDLAGLPGIGPAMADRIIQTRSHDRLCRLDDLRKVSGIGPRRLEALTGRVIFGDPLCAVSAAK